MKSLLTIGLAAALSTGCFSTGFHPIGPLVGPDGIMPMAPQTPEEAQRRRTGPTMLNEVPDVPPPPRLTDIDVTDANAAEKLAELQQELTQARGATAEKPIVSSSSRK